MKHLSLNINLPATRNTRYAMLNVTLNRKLVSFTCASHPNKPNQNEAWQVFHSYAISFFGFAWPQNLPTIRGAYYGKFLMTYHVNET